MPNYTELELPDLMDLLVWHTNEYRKMLRYSSYTIAEFAQCKLALAEIHAAVKSKIEQGGYLMKNVIPNFPDYIMNPSTDITPPDDYNIKKNNF
ncbi:MAG: hypothetical protein ABI675_17340 [Chitinophagaceae bacterium]